MFKPFVTLTWKYKLLLRDGQAVSMMREFLISRLCAQFERGDVSGILPGVSGYSCRQYLWTRFNAPQTRPERRYNVAQIRTRNTVERMFGVWKRMFPCLTNSLRTKLEITLTVIIATAVLYNFARSKNDPWKSLQGFLFQRKSITMHDGNGD